MQKQYLILLFFITFFPIFTILSKTNQVLFVDEVFVNTNQIRKFIPNGFSILDSISGNLNGDKYRDLILILKKEGEDTMYNPAPKRPMLILTGMPNLNYKIAVKNEYVIYSHDMGGVSKHDPYNKVEIENNIFKIEHSGGMGRYSWTSTISFQYFSKEKKWYLVKMETNELVLEYRSEGEETEVSVDSDSTRIQTEKDFGKILFENFNIYLDVEK